MADVKVEVENKRDGIRIILDKNLCIGAATCTVMAPNTFGLDDEGKVKVLNPSGDSKEKIVAAAESCPVLAITIKSEDGKRIFPRE